MVEEEINLKEDAKKFWKKTSLFLKQKKVQNILVIIALLAIIVLGTWIRVQNLPLLKDSTTGEYIPLALDPYYFLRVSETLVETNGNLPEFDDMRSPHLNITWAKEILPQTTLILHKIISIFSPNSTLRFANVLNPVIFFAVGLIIFFFLIWLLTKNKWIAILSSFILTIIPPYLYRTLAGFSDHEAIGIVGVFLALFFFAYGLLSLDKKKLNLIKAGVIGLVAGFFTMFAIAGWGGGGKFLFMIFPLAFFIRWLTKKDKILQNNLSFYSLWILGIFLGAIFFGYQINYILKGYLLSISGILTLFVLGYIIIEFILTKSNFFSKKVGKYKRIISLVITLILSMIFYQLLIGNLFAMILHLMRTIIYPFGTDRVSLTVAENAQPYLNDLISQISKFMFYTFLFGCFIVGIKLSKGIEKKKLKGNIKEKVIISSIITFLFLIFNIISLISGNILLGKFILFLIVSILIFSIIYILLEFVEKFPKKAFISTFAIFILGILFSRISSSSILNGENFLSKAFFFISFLFFAVSSIYIYFKSNWEIETKWIFIAAWMVPMLLSVRSAVRVFFAIVPFISFIVPLTFFEIGKYAKKNKDDLIKLLVWTILILLIIGFVFTMVSHYKIVKSQAESQSPSYNLDWQKAMEWVRKNTPEKSIFLHWWDYGYWVQTGGQRPTVADGGHSQTGFGDHLIGRYVLTTPYPETAKSFMKTHNVSYLLIDPTDIGKYPAYSSIGNDKETNDRSSFIVTFLSNPSEIQETKEGEIRFYNGGIVLDDDVFYEDKGEKILFAKEDSILGGIILEKISGNYAQPIGVFIKNNNQYKIPLRYLFIGGELRDYGKGIESIAYIYPNLYSSSSGQQIDAEGAAIYLSEKTKDSLVVKLYLMGDPLSEYPEMELVREESPYPFNFYYQGFRGPIRIWSVDTKNMTNIITHEEFKRISGEYGEFDDLIFTK